MKDLIKILFFLCNLVFILIAFNPFSRLTFIEWFGLSFVVCYFYTKNILDKNEFENKINELKEEINKITKNNC